MKNNFFFVLSFTVFIASMLLSGCLNQNEQPITVEKRNGDVHQSVAYKEPLENEKALKVLEILKNADWKKTESDMDEISEIPDYVFYFNKRKSGTKIVVYSVWTTPDKNKLILTKDNDSQYVRLNKKDSASIFDAITDYEH